MKPPIILIGTHRSGTTWLASVLAQHPSLAYWSEPKYIWSWGNNYKPDDVLLPEDASPKVIKHIRQRFQTFVSLQGADRLVEKTPSNCLRIRFIQTIFPEAKFLHVIRDGRSVFRSTDSILKDGFFRQDVLSKRLREMLVETPVSAWSAYLPQMTDTLIRKLKREPLKFWGPRPPGWRTWLKVDTPNIILAKQWVGTIERAVEDSCYLPSENYLRFYYEDFVNQPDAVLEDIFKFVSLSNNTSVLNYAKNTLAKYNQIDWRDALSPSLLGEIRPTIEPTLVHLGYEW